jgi:ankyrin repeat protein
MIICFFFKVLIESKTYEEHQTALHYSAKQGNLEIVEYLLSFEANIEVRDYQNRTPLFLASEHGLFL